MDGLSNISVHVWPIVFLILVKRINEFYHLSMYTLGDYFSIDSLFINIRQIVKQSTKGGSKPMGIPKMHLSHMPSYEIQKVWV